MPPAEGLERIAESWDASSPPDAPEPSDLLAMYCTIVLLLRVSVARLSDLQQYRHERKGFVLRIAIRLARKFIGVPVESTRTSLQVPERKIVVN